jgi:molybdopterin-binding protein
MKDPQLSRTIPLKVRNLTISFDGKEVVNVASLHVMPGEVLAIMGPNGSGKTTLLLTMALLLKPTSGEVLYDDVPVIERGEILRNRRRIAVVFQDPLLLNLSVRDNVNLGLHLRGIKGSAADARTMHWLDRFGIAHLAKQPARTLSGGEAKRTSLARAFVLHPEILFLDEPFNALDAPTRQSLTGDFQAVLHETGVTTVMVTHDRNEALALADRVTIMISGRIRAIGSPGEVFSCTEDEELARFVDIGNIIHGVINAQDSGLVTIKIGDLVIEAVSDLPTGMPVATCLSYDDITLLLPENQTVSSARNRFAGTITRMLPAGSTLRITVDCGFPLVAVITRRSWEDMRLDIGQKVIASFKASSVRLIPLRPIIHESNNVQSVDAVEKTQT